MQCQVPFPHLQMAAFIFRSCHVYFQRWRQITITLAQNKKSENLKKPEYVCYVKF